MLSEPEIVSLLSFSALVLVYMMTFLKPEKEDEEREPFLPPGKKSLKINPYLPFMSPIMHSPFYYTQDTSHRMICLHLDA